MYIGGVRSHEDLPIPFGALKLEADGEACGSSRDGKTEARGNGEEDRGWQNQGGGAGRWEQQTEERGLLLTRKKMKTALIFKYSEARPMGTKTSRTLMGLPRIMSLTALRSFKGSQSPGTWLSSSSFWFQVLWC